MLSLLLAGTDSNPEITVGFHIDWPSFTIGIFAGFGIVLFILFIKYLINLVKSDNKEWEKRERKSNESDE